jgi:hypothetical protein
MDTLKQQWIYLNIATDTLKYSNGCT